MKLEKRWQKSFQISLNSVFLLIRQKPGKNFSFFHIELFMLLQKNSEIFFSEFLIMFQLQSDNNQNFKILIENVMSVQKPHTSFQLNPIPLTSFLKKFSRDYLLYWGSVTTTACLHFILWFICREPVGVTGQQESITIINIFYIVLTILIKLF